MAKKQIFVLSDGIGFTADTAVHSALSQFQNVEVEVNRATMVRDQARLVNVIHTAQKTGGIIVYTLVSRKLRHLFISETEKLKVPTIDVIGQLLTELSAFLEASPLGNPGAQRELSESYFRGVEAIEYTVNHDDGQDPDGLPLADIIIVGVSRTSKTPLSVFLSNQYFLRVANIPIIYGVKLPHQLFKTDPQKVIGLTISAERLMEIRKTRLERASFPVTPKYTSYNYIVKELKHSERLFAANGWSVINVTEKSIEEVAAEILQLMEQVHLRLLI
ncbi:MAG: kinase/pyrophosphorylase [Candidatus Bathyarchaeota archaeon]|nr:MAG: kinase/pyrophosphorylase [Candidatus Bathyarchaeota archaeon]